MKQPSVKAPSDTFTGEVWYDAICRGEAPEHVRVSLVRFGPGSRSAWHVHARGQTLHVLDGVGRIQARGGDVIEMHAGDTTSTQPGEWHWHGASPDHFMTHLAIWEVPTDGSSEIEWGDLVSETDYSAHDA